MYNTEQMTGIFQNRLTRHVLISDPSDGFTKPVFLKYAGCVFIRFVLVLFFVAKGQIILEIFDVRSTTEADFCYQIDLIQNKSV